MALSILFATPLTHTTHAASGQSLALKGTNKCQCGLDVAELSHNCNLGHTTSKQTTARPTTIKTSTSRRALRIYGCTGHWRRCEGRSAWAEVPLD